MAQASAAQELSRAQEAGTAIRQRCLALFDSLRTAARLLLRIDAAVREQGRGHTDHVIEPVTPVRDHPVIDTHSSRTHFHLDFCGAASLHEAAAGRLPSATGRPIS